MAWTINPAVSRVTRLKWSIHVGLFSIGVGVGALVTYAVARGLYVVSSSVSTVAWLTLVIPVIGLAALRDVGAATPVPYPARRQVPEWFRRVLSPGLTAFAYGGQLGTGFLTRFTYSTHTAFVVLISTQSSAFIVGVAISVFAICKSIVVVSSWGGTSYAELERRLLVRHRPRGHMPLRFANAALAAVAATVLIINI